MALRAPRLALAPALLVVATLASPAAAQTSPADQALGTALFKDGRALLAAGKIDEACPKLAQSYALDPGLGTLLNLAVCHEKQGKIASAWGELNAAKDLAARTKEEARFKFASEQASVLEARLARLVVHPVGPAEGLSLHLDGRDVGTAGFGTAMPLDPGDHRVEITAPGKRAFSMIVKLDPGPSSKTIDVPVLVDDSAPPPVVAPAPAAAPPIVAPAPAPALPPPAVTETASRSTPRFAAGLAVGGLGLAGIAVGAYFGAHTFQQKSAIGTHCTPSGDCDQTGFTLQQDAHSSATISTIAVAAGLVAVAGGVVLIVTSRSSAPAKSAWITPAVGPSTAGLQAGATW
jgi:hypothetical protein